LLVKASGNKNYADDNISVCDSWRSFFNAFLGDVGEKPVSVLEKRPLGDINVNGIG
jgi:hypothetical protein